MVITLNYKKYLLLSLLLFILNIINWPTTFFYIIFGSCFLLINSLILGHWLFIKNSWVCKFLFGLLFLMLISSLIGTAAFYFWFLNELAYIFILAITPLLLFFIVKKTPLVFDFNFKIKKLDPRLVLLSVFYITIYIILWYLLYSSQTEGSIRTPWEALPEQFFFLYFLATLVLMVLIKFSKGSIGLFLIIAHSFLSLSATWIIYQIGFDYDPFIHRTNVDLILANGTLLPKPFYYIGQYSIIIFLYQLLQISSEYLDKLLVPLLAAVYLPATIYYSFRDNFKVKKNLLLLVIVATLIFPFTNFIVTTPQALANFFFYITILLSLYYITHSKASVWPIGLLVLMTISIHPLSGIPLFFFFMLLVIYQHWKKKFKLPKFLHQSILWEIVALGSLALPTAFLLNSLTLSQLKVSLQANWFQNILNSIGSIDITIFYKKFISLTDLIYTYSFNIIYLLIALFLIGFFFIYKNKQIKRYLVYLLSFIILIINYLLLESMVSFFSLISYEQLTYPRRILELSFYMLAPFMIISLYLFFKKIFQQKSSIILLVLIMLSLAITFNLYLSYPRVDKIIEDHGYSTSITDIKTVNLIDNIQKDEPYIVLAAQPVSAAALRELGFKYYYNDFFFYPVPTGEKLYQLYEELAYAKQPTSDVIETTRFLTGVDVIYFVVNDYWFDAKEIIEAHKESSDDWFAVDGKNYIFKYWN